MNVKQKNEPIRIHFFDNIGIGISGLCITHCLLAPVALVALPFLPFLDRVTSLGTSCIGFDQGSGHPACHVVRVLAAPSAFGVDTPGVGHYAHPQFIYS